MHSVNGEPSILLWIASACIAFLGARTFVEYLRRLNYDGPVRLWRELLLCSAALTGGLVERFGDRRRGPGVGLRARLPPAQDLRQPAGHLRDRGDDRRVGHIPSGMAFATGRSVAGGPARCDPAGGRHLVDRRRAGLVLANAAAAVGGSPC